LSFHYSYHHRHLSSFPTRRSSDLTEIAYSLQESFTCMRRPMVSPLHSNGHAELQRENVVSAFGDLASRPDLRPELLLKLTGKLQDRKSTRLNSSHVKISYAVFCLK